MRVWLFLVAIPVAILSFAFGLTEFRRGEADDTVPTSQPSEPRPWLEDYADSVSIIALAAGAVGVAFVAQQLRQAEQSRRIDQLPMVRVDVLPGRGRIPNMSRPSGAVTLDGFEVVVDESFFGARETIYAWFQNLQTHALGQAFGIRAKFSIAWSLGTAQERKSFVFTVPYLANGKPVAVKVVSFPPQADVAVDVVAFGYLDGTHRTVRRAGATSREPTFGRLTCGWAAGEYFLEPQFIPFRPWYQRLLAWGVRTLVYGPFRLAKASVQSVWNQINGPP